MAKLVSVSQRWTNGYAPLWPFELNRKSPLASGLVGLWVVGGAQGGKIVNLANPGRSDGLVASSNGDVAEIGSANSGLVANFSGDATSDQISLGTIDAGDPLGLGGLSKASIFFRAMNANPIGTKVIIEKGQDVATGWKGYSLVSVLDTHLAMFVDFNTATGKYLLSEVDFFSANEEIVGGLLADLSGDNATFYKNGTVFPTNNHGADSPDTFPSITTGMSIGNIASGGVAMWPGWIKWVGVWSRLLPAHEVALLQSWSFIAPRRTFVAVPAAVVAAGGVPSGLTLLGVGN